MITAIVPTVEGREHYLEKCIASFGQDVEVIVKHGFPTCGKAWLEGLNEATGDYLLGAADDFEMHPGWQVDATRFADMGYLPAPRILNTDGSLQSCGEWETEAMTGSPTEFARTPFLSRAQWEIISPLVVPFLEQDVHYFTDNIFGWAGARHGMQTVVCRTFEFTHHLAPQRRGAGMSWADRMRHDYELFLAYTQAKASG